MDDNTPATKSDLRALSVDLHDELRAFEQSMNARFDRIHEDIDRVLNILVKVKEKTDDHEDRIVRLEKVTA